jgi:membrane-bound serine protease (ClpP class)
MTKILFSICLLCLSSLGLADTAKPIAYAELDGTINPGSAAFLKDAILRAEKGGAQALMVKLDTPGGLLSSTRDIVRAFSVSKVPIIIYVAPGGARATSAGAIISIAAHFSAMAPGTNIGAASPVAQGGEDIKGDMGKKAKNDTAAMVRAQAILRGRDAKAAEDLVLESKSHSAEEAVKLKVVDIEVATKEDLVAKLDGKVLKMGEGNESVTLATKGSAFLKFEMTRSQQFLHFIADPNISAVLMAIGGMALYAEISSGFSLVAPGVIGAFAFLLAAVSLQMLPINIGGLLLMLLGVVLLIAEIFITSFGLLTIAGIAALGVGALFLVDTSLADIQVSLSILIPILGSFGLVAGTIGLLFARDKLAKNLDPVVGQSALILEAMPGGLSGKVQVAGEIWDFESATPLSEGAHAKVKARVGLKLLIASE